MDKLTGSFLMAFFAGSVQAGLVAHYDFSDGDLLDNEVGADYALRRAVSSPQAVSSVRLNRVEGTAVFPGGNAATAWLEAEVPETLEEYTVSFWFRTDRDFVGFPHLDLFSSHTDPDPVRQGIVVPVRNAEGFRMGGTRLPGWTGKRLHAAGVWHHVVIHRTADRTEIYYTPQDGTPGDPVVDTSGLVAPLDKIVLGLNRGKDARHRVELVNVQVFDEAAISTERLFAEGPGTHSIEHAPVFSPGRIIKEMVVETAHLRDELERLPTFDDSLQLDAYGYHSDYLPALETVPDEPRWTVELTAGLPYNFLELYLIPAADRRAVDRPGYGFPKRFRIISIDQEDAQTVLADWRDRDYPDPGRYPARFAGTDSSVKRIVVEVYRGQVEGDRDFFALDEVLVCARHFIAKVTDVEASSSFESPPFWSADYLNDQKTSYGLPVLRKPGAETRSSDFIERFEAPLDQPCRVELDLQENRQIDLMVLYPAQPPEGIVVPGYGFPGSVRIDTFRESPDGTRVHDQIVHEPELANPGNNVVRFHSNSRIIRWIRFTFDQLPIHQGKPTFALGEIGVRGLTDSHGKGAAVKLELPGKGVAGYVNLLTDGQTGGAEILPMIQWLDGLGRRSAVKQRLAKVDALRAEVGLRRTRIRMVSMIVGSIILIGLLIGIALNAVLQRRRHAKALRQQITTDLHDDIGSRMSAIGLATTYLRKVSDDPKVHERSGKIERIAREMQDSLADVLWFTNTETDSLRQVVGKLMDLAELRVPPERLNIDVTPLKQIPEFGVKVMFKRDLLLLFKEIVTNAAKHAGASEIKVEIRWQRPVLHIAVADKGKGFSVDEEKKRQHKRPHLGLSSMQRRADRLGAKLNIESAPGMGTVITMNLKP